MKSGHWNNFTWKTLWRFFHLNSDNAKAQVARSLSGLCGRWSRKNGGHVTWCKGIVRSPVLGWRAPWYVCLCVCECVCVCVCWRGKGEDRDWSHLFEFLRNCLTWEKLQSANQVQRSLRMVTNLHTQSRPVLSTNLTKLSQASSKKKRFV